MTVKIRKITGPDCTLRLDLEDCLSVPELSAAPVALENRFGTNKMSKITESFEDKKIRSRINCS